VGNPAQGLPPLPPGYHLTGALPPIPAGYTLQSSAAPQATISAAPPAGILHPEQWLENAANDLRYGGTNTWVGRAAKAIGAQPLYNNVSPQTAEVMGGPELGPLKAAKGVLETPTQPLHGPSDVVSGLAQAAAPIAGATDAAFLPAAIQAIVAQKVIAGTASAVGASPQTSQEIGNVVTAAGAAGAAKLSGASAADIASKPAQAVMEGEGNAISAAHDATAAIPSAVRKSAVGTAILGRRPEDVDPVRGMVQALAARNTVKDFPGKVAIAGPDVRAALDSAGVAPEEMTPTQFIQAVYGAKAQVGDEMMSRLSSVPTKSVFSTNGVAGKIVAAVQKMAPQTQVENPNILDAIANTAALYHGQHYNLGDIELRIQNLNNELSSAQSGLKISQDKLANDPQYAYRFAELNGLRDLENSIFNRLNMPGMGDLKQRYGALKELQNAAERRIPVIERQRDPGLYQGIGAIGGLSSAVIGGVRAAGGAVRALSGGTTDAMQAGLEQAARGALEFKIGRNLQQARDPMFLLRSAMANTPSRYAGAEFQGPTGVPPAATPPGWRGLQLPGYRGPAAPTPRALPPAPPIAGELPEATVIQGGGLKRGPSGRMEAVAPAGRVAPTIPPEEEPMQILRAKSQLVRDPKTGRMKRVYLSSPAGGKQ